MYFFAPQRPTFIKTQDGELMAEVSWGRKTTDAEKRKAHWNQRLAKISVALLIAGFAMQLLAALAIPA